jgi:hypothetical protein
MVKQINAAQGVVCTQQDSLAPLSLPASMSPGLACFLQDGHAMLNVWCPLLYNSLTIPKLGFMLHITSATRSRMHGNACIIRAVTTSSALEQKALRIHMHDQTALHTQVHTKLHTKILTQTAHPNCTAHQLDAVCWLHATVSRRCTLATAAVQAFQCRQIHQLLYGCVIPQYAACLAEFSCQPERPAGDAQAVTSRQCMRCTRSLSPL